MPIILSKLGSVCLDYINVICHTTKHFVPRLHDYYKIRLDRDPMPKQLYSLLPLSVTFKTDSHWFKFDTPYHQSENFYLLNIKNSPKNWSKFTKFLPMTSNCDLDI